MKNCSPSFDEILEEMRESIKDRRKYGFSQAMLANKLGVSREHLNRMLSNRAPMKAEYFYYLVTVLNVRIR